jgi:ligand-binding sensor domain-containing protein/signal transduction histidine kinase
VYRLSADCSRQHPSGTEIRKALRTTVLTCLSFGRRDFVIQSPARFAILAGWVFFLFGAPSTILGSYNFTVFNTDTGLPQNSVYSILQTRDGYLWFTTLDGLVRYDGAGFSVFSKANSPGIGSNRFTRLLEDTDGSLWICTEDGGLTRFVNGVFTTYTTDNGLPDNRATHFRQDESGDLLIQTHSALAKLHDGRISLVSRDLASYDIVLGYAGRFGEVWYRHGATLRCIKNGGAVDYTVPPSSDDGRFYPQLYEDREGRLWIGTDHAGLLILKDGAITKYTTKDGLPNTAIISFCEDHAGAIWMGADNGGLVRYQQGKFTTLTTRQGLPSNSVMAIYEDRENSLWVGTKDAGVVQLGPQVVTAYANDRVGERPVYSILEDSKGNVWVGADGLYRWRNGLTKYYPVRDKAIPHFWHVSALFEDTDGKIWIGTDAPLFSFKDEVFTEETEKLGLGDRYATCAIHRDRHGTLWLGTLSGLLECRDGTTKHYGTTNGLPSNEVHAILEDRDGVLWFGTYGGVVRLENGRFSSFTEQDGLSANRVRSLFQDSEGTLWIGTYDGGLNRFKDGRFTVYTTGNGLFSNGVFQILDDGGGNFWMSSNQGIYRVSRQELEDFAQGRTASIRCVSYGKTDGMHTTECNGGEQPAGIRSQDGRLWFPTIHGVAVVDPWAVTSDPELPPVTIENILLDRNEQRLDQSLTVYPGQETLEIRFAGLSFIKPEQVRFRYRLEGLDSDWVEAGNRRAAYYSHLPAGQYVFKVIAANSDGVWNDAGATIGITVVPRFWKRWWFSGIMGTALCGAVFLAYRKRIQKLERAQAAREAFARQLIASQEQERQRIAAELHDSLGQNLLVIKNWVSMARRSLEPQSRACAPLDEVVGVVSHSIEEVREIAYNLRPYQLDEIGLTEAIQSMLEKVAASSGLQFTVAIDPLDGLFSGEAEISIYRIVQECVNNIVKHSEASEAEVLIRRRSQALELVIKDNGKGFELNRTMTSKERGFGLTGINERVRFLGGKRSVQTAPGAGTAITITLELRQAKHA